MRRLTRRRPGRSSQPSAPAPARPIRPAHPVRWAAAGGLVGVGVGVVAASALAGSALRPVERMRREVEQISGADLRRRLPVEASTKEVARLAESLNAMLDRLCEAYDRQRRFLDVASHELRTPLAVLRAELDLALALPPDTERLREAVASAAEEAQAVAQMARNLLVLARANAGALPADRAPLDLDDLVHAVVARLAEGAERAHVRLQVHRRPVGPVRADPQLLRQALTNVLENAISHARRGGVVQTSVTAAPGLLTITVSDDGPGFPEAFLPHAFEPFARPAGAGPYPARDDPGGAGLGLAIVQATMQANGGWAEVANRPGGGAVVSLHLPRGIEG